MGGRCRGNYFYVGGMEGGGVFGRQVNILCRRRRKRGEGCRGDYAGDPEGGKEP